jgi:Domain of unknown function (DUF1893)
MTDLELAKEKIRAGSLAFVIVKDGAVLCIGTRDGIGELIEAVDALGAAARGASLADRVVGKAVAMVARVARLRAVYSPLASQAALDALTIDRQGDLGQVPLEYDRLVPLILNKRNDGPCPMERLTQPIHDPQQAVAALREFVRARAPVS